MNDKMTVLYVKQTGHVLAAVTRVAAPDGKIVPDELAGSGLLVRGLGNNLQTFELPTPELDVQVVNLESNLLLRPWAYSFDDASKSVSLVTAAISATTVLTKTQVTVTLGQAVVATTAKLMIQIQGGSLAKPLIIKIPDTQIGTTTTTVINVPIVTLDDGDYQMVIFVSGRLPSVSSITFP